ncbi:hypothetical protein BOTCAL_0387g00020 [Botryotinia calthae]|uniref:Uncharacterized protein n=1 Tax=Botryotinia calthae TaxID=38488 RepID=A0A4Y8CTJ4_9HELO|nr:hypothetical protein BOTCAL_0387g00020 [Botryotinia calthae]
MDVHTRSTHPIPSASDPSEESGEHATENIHIERDGKAYHPTDAKLDGQLPRSDLEGKAIAQIPIASKRLLR